MKNEYVTMAEAKKKLGLSSRSLQVYSNKGKIETIKTLGGHRRFNIKKYIEDNNIKIKEDDDKLIILYCRVTHEEQKDDLEKQIEFLKDKYAEVITECEVITDIGSSISYNRPGLKKIMELALEKKIKEVVVTNKDRLCKFGYEGIEFILKNCSSATITVNKLELESTKEEQVEELVEILSSYTIKMSRK